MLCQVQGCDNVAVIDDEDGELALCSTHAAAGVELANYAEDPILEQFCACDRCSTQRRQAIYAYKEGMKLVK